MQLHGRQTEGTVDWTRLDIDQLQATVGNDHQSTEPDPAADDEVVVTLFLAGPEQSTLPRQMFTGIRENISPTIAAVATLLTIFTTGLMLALEWIRGRRHGQGRPLLITIVRVPCRTTAGSDRVHAGRYSPCWRMYCATDGGSR